MTLVRFQKPVYNPTFNDLFNDLFVTGKPQNSVSKKSPAVNVLENETSYEIEFSVPGYKKEHFSVQTENEILTVKAEIEEKEERAYTVQNFGAVSFEKRYVLPDNVDADKIKASYQNGILTVALPKKEVEIKNKQIEIQVN